MGRPKTIHFDRLEILRTLDRLTKAATKQAEQELADHLRQKKAWTWFQFTQRRGALEFDLKDAPWLPYDLDAIAGRRLSDSERVILRRLLREWDQQDLLALDPPKKPNAVKLLAAGRALLASEPTQ